MTRKKSTDGWKEIGNYDVYCENNTAMRAVKGKGNARVSAGIYRASPKGGWINVSGRYTPETVRKGLKTGKYKIM